MLKTFLVICYFTASNGALYQSVCWSGYDENQCKLMAALNGSTQNNQDKRAVCVEHAPELRVVR